LVLGATVSEQYAPHHGARPHRGARQRWSWQKKLIAWAVAVFIALIVITVIGANVSPAKPAPRPVTHSGPVLDTVRVPDVIGMPQAIAQRVLKDDGFSIGLVTPVICGKILWVQRQSPAAGMMMPAGMAVSVASSVTPPHCKCA
jgi:beta-lactam-binding protein with PASTA domain